MTRAESEAAKEQTTRVVGVVTRDGTPIADGGRVGAWQKRRAENDRVNANLRRGRTVPSSGFEWRWVPVESDGSFVIEDLAIHPRSRDRPWFFVFDEPGGASATVGPLEIGRDDREIEVEIPVFEQGSIAGTVEHVPEAMAGQIWVVLFDDGVVRREVLANLDGSFRFDRLPPGRYGLKAGHDGSRDPHVPVIDRENPDPTLWNKPAEPWQGAAIVTVEPGGTSTGIAVDARPPGPIVEPDAGAEPEAES
ncbi:carboxypeptidase-like regulatory domain-containing protein [Tautonia sp. JC769]|uniref:carboxypeptidase-like regulatory domain-containing protein n=1 Tax=Tautonia sp. JC769 TaxID=3232135 RepID=UPI003458FA1D